MAAVIVGATCTLLACGSSSNGTTGSGSSSGTSSTGGATGESAGSASGGAVTSTGSASGAGGSGATSTSGAGATGSTSATGSSSGSVATTSGSTGTGSGSANSGTGTAATGGSSGASGESSGAGSGAGGEDAGPTVTWTEVYETIIMAKCAGCHVTGKTGVSKGKLDMSMKATAYTNLVAVMAQGTSCGTSMQVRVVAGNSAMSLLYNKISEKKPICGEQMPDDNPVLIDASIATIKAWIDEGALNN